MSLSFNKDVNIFLSLESQFRADSLTVNPKNRHAFVDSPVAGYGPFGAMNGEGFHLLDEGCTVVLTGKSQLLLIHDSH